MTAPARTDLKVALFATCFNDTMWPGTPKATVRLLERLGVRVEFPMEQACCGQVLTNTGYGRNAVPMVQRFADVFEGYDAVVAPSGSCVGSVREQHATIARQAGEERLLGRVQEVTPRVHELSEFLVDVLGVTDVGAYFPHRVTYHPTCHSLRMLGVADRPLRLLRAVAGIDLVEQQLRIAAGEPADLAVLGDEGRPPSAAARRSRRDGRAAHAATSVCA